MSWTVHKTSGGICSYYQSSQFVPKQYNDVKILAFGFEWTLVKPSELGFWISDPDKWDFCYNLDTLHKYHAKGYQIVIFTNQQKLEQTGRLTKEGFIKLVENIDNKLQLPFQLYTCHMYCYYSKPLCGMWQLCNTVNNWKPDLRKSFMVGNNAGRCINSRGKSDNSSEDYYFSCNIHIPFKTPEQFFLSSSKVYNMKLPISFNPLYYFQKYKDNYYEKINRYRDFIKDDSIKQHMILLVGSPACGKSRLCKTYLIDYARINQDDIGSFSKCLSIAKQKLEEGRNIIIDNTNRNAKIRNKWFELANKYNVHVDCIFIKIIKNMALHFNGYRNLNNPCKSVPDIAIHSYFKQMQEPIYLEGFRQIITLQYDQLENDSVKDILTKYIRDKYAASHVIESDALSETSDCGVSDEHYQVIFDKKHKKIKLKDIIKLNKLLTKTHAPASKFQDKYYPPLTEEDNLSIISFLED